MSRGPDDRITFATLGVVDEIVVSNCTVHLELMDTGRYYLGIYDDGGLLIQTSIQALNRRRIEAYVYGLENADGIKNDLGVV